MHKIGIISDTHGLLRPEVVQALTGCEAILHGGDINSRKILEALNRIAPTCAVRGNNDKEWAEELPKTLAVTLCGIRFFIVHNKKEIPKALEDADIVVYGHSHKYEEKYMGSRLFLNPGSCGPRRFTQPITLAVLTTAGDGSYQVHRIEIAHQPKGTEAGGRAAGASAAGSRKTDSRKGGAVMGADAAQDRALRPDMKKIVKAVIRDTDKKMPVREIAVKNGIDEELAEQICRLYLTHPGVTADGILGKMGL